MQTSKLRRKRGRKKKAKDLILKLLPKKLTRKDWFLALDIICLAGATIYLFCFQFFMYLAYYNHSWTYIADKFTFTEFIMALFFASYLVTFIIRKVINYE